MELSIVRQLVDETKSLTRGIAEFEQVEEAAWAIILKSGLLLEVVYEEDEGVLLIVSDLGVPAETNRLPIYEMLLSANYLVDDTGVVMALEAVERRVVQRACLNTTSLDARLLAVALENFATKAETWMELMQSTESVPPDETVELRDAMRV